MPKTQPTHNSSIDELEVWINDSSKCSNKKKLKKIDEEVNSNKKLQIKTKEDDKLNKKILLKDKYSRESDPLYGKKGAERKHVIEEYRKQQMLKNSNNSNEVSPEMINNFMNKIKNSGHNPEEIMKKLESDQYSSEYKNQLMEDILK